LEEGAAAGQFGETTNRQLGIRKSFGVTGEGSGSISPARSRPDAAYNSGECGGRNAPQLRATA